MLSPGDALRLGGKDISAKEVVIKHITGKIRHSAEQGAVSIFVPVNYGFNPIAFDEAIADFKALGYRMSEETFDGRPHIRIRWNKIDCA